MKILLNILFVLFFTLSCKLQIGTLNSVLDIYLDASDDVSKNIISPATTTVLLETTATSLISSTAKFDIKVRGFDASRLTLDDTKGKVKAFVQKVEGIKHIDSQTNSLVYTSSVAGNIKPVDLDDIGHIPPASFSLSLDRPNTISFTANDSLMDRLRKKITFVGDVGVLKVTLECYDNNNEKLSYTIDLFIVVRRTA